MEYESLTLILLVDTSNSVLLFAKSFSVIISSLTSFFHHHKDRIGMIVLQGNQAQIVNHPTHNIRVIIRGLKSLKIKGATPLADGIFKALSTAKISNKKNPGSKSLVVLISDCYPEPLSGNFSDLFEEPAYQNTLLAAGMYKKDKIPLLLINPNFYHENQENYFPGEKLSKKITDLSGGKLIKLFKYKETSTSHTYLAKENVNLTKQDISEIINGIQNYFNEIRLN
ncbi:MAG: vWA domain-containing protein [bacterium]